MSSINLSIIIVNYNTGKLVKTCVEKILQNTKDLSVPNSEIIIVDNASTVEPIDETWIPTTKSVTLIKNRENIGYAKANNQALRIARGKHYLLLNSDTEIKSGSFSDLLQFAEKSPDAGVVGTKLVLPSGEVQTSVFRFPTIWRAFQEFLLKQKNKYSPFVPPGTHPVAVEAVVGAVFLITNKAKEKVGFLDERYFKYFEDLDYCKRVNSAGLKVYYLPTVEFLHQHGASGRELANAENQWRRLIPASITYHGWLKHTIITWILKIGQKLG